MAAWSVSKSSSAKIKGQLPGDDDDDSDNAGDTADDVEDRGEHRGEHRGSNFQDWGVAGVDFGGGEQGTKAFLFAGFKPCTGLEDTVCKIFSQS